MSSEEIIRRLLEELNATVSVYERERSRKRVNATTTETVREHPYESACKDVMAFIAYYQSKGRKP